MRRFIGLALWLGLIAAVPTSAAPVEREFGAYGQLLEEANALRSANPQRFDRLVSELERRRNEASPEQRQHVAYLSAFRAAFRGDREWALLMSESLLNEASDPALRYRVGAFAASNYAAMRRYSDAYRILNQILPLADRVADTELRQQGLNAAGYLAASTGRNQRALDYVERVLNDAPGNRERCFAHGVAIQARYALGTLHARPADIAAGLSACETAGEIVVSNHIHYYQARLWQDQGRHAQARSLLEQHLAAVEQTGFIGLIVEFHALLAELCKLEGDTSAARTHALYATSQASEHDDFAPLASAMHTLYALSKLDQQFSAALDYHEKYVELARRNIDDIRDRERALAKEESASWHDQRGRELLLANIRLENERQQLERQILRNIAWVTALLGLVTTLTAGLGMRLLRIQRRLRHRATSDPLSGAMRRIDFELAANRLLEVAWRAGRTVCVIVLELRRLKSINEMLGLDAGDRALRATASQCLNELVDREMMGRLSSARFAIVMDGADSGAAIQRADVFRQLIRQIDHGELGLPQPLSVNLGVSTSANDGYSLDRLIQRAESRLSERVRVPLAIPTEANPR